MNPEDSYALLANCYQCEEAYFLKKDSQVKALELAQRHRQVKAPYDAHKRIATFQDSLDKLGPDD